MSVLQCRYIYYEKICYRNNSGSPVERTYVNDTPDFKKYLAKVEIEKKFGEENSPIAFYCKALVVLNTIPLTSSAKERLTRRLVEYFKADMQREDAVTIFWKIMTLLSEYLEAYTTRGIRAKIRDSGGDYPAQSIEFTYYG